MIERRNCTESGMEVDENGRWVLYELYEKVERERDEARLRLLSAAGDDLCRLSQEEIKELSSGVVKIPPKEEFLPSCERFHAQISGEAGVLTNCLTLAQLIAENEKQRRTIEELTAPKDTSEEPSPVQQVYAWAQVHKYLRDEGLDSFIPYPIAGVVQALAFLQEEIKDLKGKLKKVEDEVEEGLKTEMGDGYVAAFATMLKRILKES